MRTIVSEQISGQARLPFSNLLVFLMVIGLPAVSAPVHGHVAPSVKENNRYIKLTAFGDRVRLAYIVYVGEIPGRSARERLDRDGDGRLTDDEISVARLDWRDRVSATLKLKLGDVDHTLKWESIHVGMADRSARGGAFSIDLIAWACLGNERSELLLRDALVLEKAGETEVIAEESPGTEITRLAIGGAVFSSLTWSKVGATPELATPGVALAWTADTRQESEMCKRMREQARPRQSRTALLGGAIAVALALAAFGLAIVARRRRQRDDDTRAT